MPSNLWDKVLMPADLEKGKEEEQSRERLAAFLEALLADARSGSLFKHGLLSFTKCKLPNGYSYDFVLRQGVPLDERHEWGEPKPSRSMTERKISRCVHCGSAYAKRADGKRCNERARKAGLVLLDGID